MCRLNSCYANYDMSGYGKQVSASTNIMSPVPMLICGADMPYVCVSTSHANIALNVKCLEEAFPSASGVEV